MSRLISMTDFVFEQSEKRHEKTNDYGSTPISTGTDFDRCLNYAKFLKQKLELCMFVPCKLVDGVCEILGQHIECDCVTQYNEECCGMFFKYEEYQEAKERCLFEGLSFEISHKREDEFFVCIEYEKKSVLISWFNTNGEIQENITIEDLVKHDLELTKTAQKQIGL